jgi:hypothetical protein
MTPRTGACDHQRVSGSELVTAIRSGLVAQANADAAPLMQGT